MAEVPYIVGVGGTSSPGSSTEQALEIALRAAAVQGARVKLFGGEHILNLPHYTRDGACRSEAARKMVAAVRAADGLIIASPSYHGSVSGLVKNAIDYLEETCRDQRAYLDGLPVGLIVTAYGWQATGATLGTLRAIVHALRGWPTPYGAAIKSSAGMFESGVCADAGVRSQLELVGRQVLEFCLPRRRQREEVFDGQGEAQ